MGSKKLELEEKGPKDQKESRKGWGEVDQEQRGGSQKNTPREPFLRAPGCSVKGDLEHATGALSSMPTTPTFSQGKSAGRKDVLVLSPFKLFSNFTTQTLCGVGIKKPHP